MMELDHAIEPPSYQSCRLTRGSCRLRRLGVTTNTGAVAAAILAGGGKVALAEET